MTTTMDGGRTRETAPRRTVSVLGAPFDVIDWDTALGRIRRWAEAHESRYVCICNAHSVVTATRDADFARALASADMATPDGAPVAWMARRLGHAEQTRINGPDLMAHYFEQAADIGEPVFLYGGTQATLDALVAALRERLPELVVAGAYSPPFRPLTEAEEEDVVRRVNDSGARTLWVSLGCPKQELWMARMHGRIRAVMVGVGAAFDFHAGTIARAPAWMQGAGLEWLHRLSSEPRRLWKRYLVTNTAFIVGAARQLLSSRTH